MTTAHLTAAWCAAATVLAACSQEQATQPPAVASTAAIATSATAAATARPSAPAALSCDWPVEDGDTAATVMDRFGVAAERAELDGPEGTTLPGLVLWGGDPRRRIELMLDDEAPADRIAGWRIAEGSGWSFADLRIGDPLERITAINGAPFRFYGFAWDYGGYVTDWKGGKLDKPAGGCGLSVRLSPLSENLPNSVMGEDEISSDSPAVVKVGASVAEISVGFGGG